LHPGVADKRVGNRVGLPKRIDAMVERCAVGPAAARVSAVVRTSPDPDEGALSAGFHQRPTA